MSFFSCKRKVGHAVSLLGVFLMLGLCSSAPAATWTWDDVGLPGSVWNTDGQWTTAGVPNFDQTLGGTDELTFGASSNTTVYMGAVNEQVKSCTFDATAPAYTFKRSPATSNSVRFYSTVATDVVWANNSANTQTYESAVYFPGGTVNLGSGSGVALKTVDNLATASGSFIYFGLGGTSSSTNTVTITGTRTIEIAGGMKGNYGQTTINTTADITIDGRWTWSSNSNVNAVAMVKSGPGTLTFNGNTYNDDSALCQKGMNINEGIVRIRNATALGVQGTGSSVVNCAITIASSAWTGRLELANNITFNNRKLALNGRNNDNAAPHILNYSDSNTLSGSIALNSGDSLNYNIGSATGLLTIQSTLNQNNAGYGILNFSGAGDIAVLGNITSGGSGKYVGIRKYDAGTLTLSGAANTFNGPLVVKGGTVVATAATAIDSASAYHVGSGTLDLSALGGYAPASGKTLSGSGAVLGDVAINAGSFLAAGNVDSLVGGATGSFTFSPTAGTLTLNNNLNVSGGTLQFNLANVTTVGGGINDLISVGGNLTLNTGTIIDVSMLNVKLVPGSYRLIDYAGSYFHDYGSIESGVTVTGLAGGVSRQTYALSDAVAHQINLNVVGTPLTLTWSGNGTNNNWDLNSTQDWNSGSQKFFNGDFVTFNDSGSNSPAVNLVGDLEPGSLTVENTAKDYTFAGYGAIVGATGLTKNGTGKLTFTNSSSNTLSGDVSLNAGTLAFNQTVDSTLTGSFSGAGSLRQEGTGVLTLAGASTAFTGTVTVTGGVLKLGNAAALGDVATGTTVNGGTLDANGLGIDGEVISVQGSGYLGQGALVNTNATSASFYNVVMNGDTTVGGVGTSDRVSGRLSLVNSLQGNSHNLTKVGGNAVQINGTAETNLADIFVNEGNLIFVGTATMGDPTKTVTVANNAILSVYGTTLNHAKPVKIDVTGGQFANWSGNNTVDSNFTMNGNLALLTGANTLTLNGALTGTGSLTRDNTPTTTGGTVYLLSDGNNYTGTTTINSGTLSVGNGGTTGSLGGTGEITLGMNATLVLNRQGTIDIPRNIVGMGLSTNAVQYGVGGVVDLRNTIYNVAGNNSYSGQTYVHEGMVVLSKDTGLGDTAGNTVVASGSAGFATVALTGNINVAENFEILSRGAGGVIAAAYVPHIASLSGNNTLSGFITTGTNSSGSVYTISSLGTAPGDLLTISNSLDTGQTGSRSLWLRGPGKGEVTGSVGSYFTSGNWSGVIIADGGTWTFSSANNYTGGTYIYAGSKLALKGTGSISGSTVINLADSTSVLDLSLSTPDSLPAQTLTLGSTQSLVGKGTIQGSVATSYGNILAPSTARITDYNPLNPTPRVTNFNQQGGTMTITGNLSLAAGGETLQFKLASSTTDANNDKIAVGGALNMNGSYPVNVSVIPNTTMAAGSTYTVLTSANAWTGFNTFQLDTVNNKTRYTFELDTSTPKALKVKVLTDNHATLTWSGASSAVWDVMYTMNWTGGPADNQFYQADAVNFTDASDVLNVTVGDSMNPYIAPASINVDSSKDYTFSGTGRITGGTGINKSGTGTLTIANPNDFNGEVDITGGTVKLGSTSALGSEEGATAISGSGTLDLAGYYNLRREPISVAGQGVGSNGALVNNAANVSASVNPHMYYVTLTGDAALGGSNHWSIEGPTLQSSGWAHGYLHGNGHALTKVGASYLTLNDLGETGLGDIFLNGGRIYLQGNTTMGNGGPSRLYLANGTLLCLLDSTVTHAKPITVDTTGGRIHTSSGISALTSEITANGTLIASAASDTTQTLSGPISGVGGLSKISAGKVVLAGDNTYQGETLISDGTLELAPTGQISVLSSITNDAVLQVNGGAHSLGTINGAGTMNVLGASIVTASSISQGTLTIGGSAVALNAVVPEPGTWTLLLIGLIAAASLRRFRSR